MPLRHCLLAVLVAVTWGLNFPAIHLALQQFPPFFCVALRFALVALPALLLVPRPRVRTRWLLGYGLGFGVLQFAFLYLAMVAGMPTGLASLVLQSSAPFTVLLAAAFLRERLGVRQAAGVALAVLGLGGIALHRAGLEGAATLLPVVLTLCGGLGWAFGNLCTRQAQADSPFRLMMWMAVVPPLPMLALSLVVEGPRRIADSFDGLTTPPGWAAVGGSRTTVATGASALLLAGLAERRLATGDTVHERQKVVGLTCASALAHGARLQSPIPDDRDVRLAGARPASSSLSTLDPLRAVSRER